ncbi:hypothetical protein ACFY2R_01710 [Micromonospora olivasterospora]|uniref:Methyltransferase family protein n=1 Tax=Micromonospora olivasterospora TaxID=1880 RepID=A0A562ID11_MICOL|nr:hypothetical protein [Micromonospora olivasterospora]TWH68605.1 hypothetical protein JD77_03602 [Micromonospora olivasterospora]
MELPARTGHREPPCDAGAREIETRVTGGPVDFRFFDADTVAKALTEAGFTVEATLERAPYPQEAETRRGYLLARA